MDSPGIIIAASRGQLDPGARSTDVTAALAFANSRSVNVGAYPLAVSHGTSQPAISIAHHNVSGRRQEMFGGQLFERIIVLPRVKALGFVLTASQFPVEVWNTFRDSDQTLETITITGQGGLLLSDPYGEPLIFAALDSFIYQATIPSSGPAQIDQDVAFGFLSGILGADLHITGSRITLFSVAPDWGEGVEERLEYLTDVLVKYSDAEQRRGLRQLPRRSLSYRALTLNARDAAGMESLVWGWQNQPYGVPWWPDSGPLLSDIGVGTFVIPVDTTNRQYAVGGLICLWVDEYTFEALSIIAVGSNTVTCSSPTQFAWVGNPKTRVMPVFLCRIPNSVSVRRHSSEIDELNLAFIGEAGQPSPAESISPTVYKGYDVLEVAPNWREAPLSRTYKRSITTIDPKIGQISVIDKGGTAIVGQEFPWWIDGHANISAFRAFIRRRFGRLNAFWVPTWDQDLVLFQDVLSTDSGMRIDSEFYTRFFFPSRSRRFVALIPIDGSGNVYREIVTAHDNGDGTENLVFDSATGKNFPKVSTMVSFLTLARLGSDSTAIKWDSTEHAESKLEFVEVPREVPA